MLHPRFTLVTVALVLGGCIPKIDDDLSTVSEPRVLAVRSTPAEAAKGDGVTLDALVAAPEGVKAPPIDWELCVDRKPLTELGPVSPACLVRSRDPSVELPLPGGVVTAVPQDACSSFGPDPPAPTATQPGGRPVDPDVTGGYYEPVVAFLGSSEKSLGMIRLDCGLPSVPREVLIDYNERHRLNENPALDAVAIVDGSSTTDIAVDGTAAPATVSAGAHVTLRATWAACPRSIVCGDGICSEGETNSKCASTDGCTATTGVGCTGAETYAWYDPGAGTVVDRRESVTVSWYVTAGDIDDRRTGVAETDPDVPHVETGWTAPTGARDVVLWAVIRDDRGGVSWGQYRLRVSP